MSKYFGQSPDLLTVEQIKEYLYYCKDKQGLSVSFINQTIGAVRILFRDVLGIGDSHLSIKRPRRNHHMPVVLSKEEVHKLLDSHTNPKHKAIIAVLYSTGIRRDELLNLKIGDIDSQRMVIRIAHGKGNKARDVILARRTLELLRQYYQQAHPSTYLFESPRANIRYSSTSVSKILHKAALKAGIQKKVTAHTLRHTFATHMLEQGVNLKLIQRLLGHTSLRSTMIYLHLASIDPAVKSPIDLP